MGRFVGVLLLASAAACSSSTEPRHLSFEARSTVSPTPPMTVETVVTVRNTGNATTQIEVSECPRSIKAFTTPKRSGTPLWSSNNPAVICDAMARIRSLGPGDYYDYHFSGTIPSSLPSGNYFLAVEMGYALVPAGQFSKF